MVIINISIYPELLEKVNKYKKVVDKIHSEFFTDAVELYFRKIDENIAFENRKKL